MANTTLRSLASISGSALADTDKFLVHDDSVNVDYNVSLADLRTAIGNGTFTVTTTSSSDALVVTSTDAGATAAPDIIFYRNSASPAASDTVGNIVFRGKNSAAVNKDYAAIYAGIGSATSTTESGSLAFSTMNAGTLSERMRIREDGNIGIGGVGSAGVVVSISKNLSATSSYGTYVAPTAQTGVSTFISNLSSPAVANAAFTLGIMAHYWAYQGTIGSAATVTNQYGFVTDSNLIGATNNYGFLANAISAASVTTGKTVYGVRSNHLIATGGGTSWNFYAGGTAPNYFSGNVGIGTTSASAKLHVVGQIAGGYTAHTAGTTVMVLGTNTVVKVTPNATATYTTTVAPAGSYASIIVETSGTTSYTITFGTGFKSAGTLATGTVTAKTFVISFVSDGTNMIETSRTVAM